MTYHIFEVSANVRLMKLNTLERRLSGQVGTEANPDKEKSE